MRPRGHRDAADTTADESGLPELLDYIARERDRRRDEILEAARAEADELVRDGLREAHERVREAVARERRDSRNRLQAARAAEDSRLRERRHALTRDRLDRAWQRLEQRIAQRWDDAEARRAWIRMALDEAAVHLPAGTWTLEHPADFDPEAEPRALAHVGEQRPDVSLRCVASDEVTAGVRLRIGQALLDATPEALLRHSRSVEGLLLGRLEPAQRERDR